MTDLYVSVQLRAPPHHGPVGQVDSTHGTALSMAQRISELVIDASTDGTIENGGCLFITVQRHVPRPQSGHPLSGA